MGRAALNATVVVAALGILAAAGPQGPWVPGPRAGEAQVATPGIPLEDPQTELEERLAEVDRKVLDGEFQGGLEAMREVVEEHPEDAEVLWRLSRVKADVAFELEEGDSRQEELHGRAVEVGRKAVEVDPEHPEAHVSVAIAAGRAGLVSGIRERVELSREVLEHAERALELSPDHDVALHVRGRWHHEVATLGVVARTALEAIYGGLPDASLEEAVADFRRAIEVEDRVIHRYKMGRTLLEKGEREEARRQLERAVEMPPDAPRSDYYRERARELLEDV